MKIKAELIKPENKSWPDEKRITFIPETVEEQKIMSGLHNHFFFGDPWEKTFPVYDGVTSEETPDGTLVTSLTLKYDLLK